MPAKGEKLLLNVMSELNCLERPISVNTTPRDVSPPGVSTVKQLVKEIEEKKKLFSKMTAWNNVVTSPSVMVKNLNNCLVEKFTRCAQTTNTHFKTRNCTS